MLTRRKYELRDSSRDGVGGGAASVSSIDAMGLSVRGCAGIEVDADVDVGMDALVATDVVDVDADADAEMDADAEAEVVAATGN